MMDPIKKVLEVCRRHRRFLITTHQSPDADAAASALGMAVFLKGLGKKVFVVNEDALPKWLEFLPYAKLFKRTKEIKARGQWYDAAIVLDCGDLARCGNVQKLLLAGQPLINIDHHVTNDRFGGVNLLLTGSSSTCEIVFEVIRSARFKMNKSLAILLYAGIMTDTGSFRYENTGSRTHGITAELMAYGINASLMHQHLYVGIPVVDMKLFIEVIHQSQLLLNNKVYAVVLPKKTMSGFSKKFDLKEKLFGFLRAVEGIEVVVIFTEVNAKETRVNLRSQGHFDVAKLSTKFNGGGHKKAAGAKIPTGLADAQKQVINAITRELKR